MKYMVSMWQNCTENPVTRYRAANKRKWIKCEGATPCDGSLAYEIIAFWHLLQRALETTRAPWKNPSNQFIQTEAMHAVLLVQRKWDTETNCWAAQNKTMTYSALVLCEHLRFSFFSTVFEVTIFVYFVLIITHLSGLPLRARRAIQSAYSCATAASLSLSSSQVHLHRQLRVYYLY